MGILTESMMRPHQESSSNKKNQKLLRSSHSYAVMTSTSSSTLPPSTRMRLYDLFVQIEREFEALYAENVSLHERLERAGRAT